MSQERGLVVWVVPKRGIDQRKEDVRRIALDSVLVLGAIEGEDSVAVFGRERVVPVGVLPHCGPR